VALFFRQGLLVSGVQRDVKRKNPEETGLAQAFAKPGSNTVRQASAPDLFLGCDIQFIYKNYILSPDVRDREKGSCAPLFYMFFI
jgi:hypothetical protein